MSWKKNFNIDKTVIGKDAPVFIIAEAGVAHFGNLEKALKLVDLAVSAQADAVKFQIFHTDELISKNALEWKDRYRPKELTLNDFLTIKEYCIKRGIIFLSTAHDEKSLQELDNIGVPAYKIGSGEIHNWAFIKKVARRKKPILLSTGMYTLKDIQTALEVIRSENNSKLAILHCTTAYPTPPEQVNLRAISTIKKAFGSIVGYSDHTAGYHFLLAAVVMGAKVIEKHITLDFNIPNAQDWKVSCGPETLSPMVDQIRQLEQGMGTGIKEPQKLESESLKWARKSITAALDINQDEIITADKITMKRPGMGIPPSKQNQVVGKKARVHIKCDTIINWVDLK